MEPFGYIFCQKNVRGSRLNIITALRKDYLLTIEKKEANKKWFERNVYFVVNEYLSSTWGTELLDLASTFFLTGPFLIPAFFTRIIPSQSYQDYRAWYQINKPNKDIHQQLFTFFHISNINNSIFSCCHYKTADYNVYLLFTHPRM